MKHGDSGREGRTRAGTTGIWLCDLTYTQQGVSAEVMPVAIGGLATVCEARVRHPLEIRLFKYPERLIEALAGTPPRIVGFSNYSWNSELSSGFAEAIKRRHPEVVVVMGGPNYPLETELQRQFLQTHPAVDFYVAREGELPFAELVQALIDHDFQIGKVKALGPESVHALLEDGSFQTGAMAKRLRDLSVIPSPYLAGKMDAFFDGKLMPILQTNRGCPFRCTYCNEGHSYASRVCRYPQERIAADIEYIARRMAKARALGGRNDLFIADDNFGMYAEDLDTCRALAHSREQHGWPEFITVATGKKHFHRVLEAARLLKGALRLTGSVQSLDEEVLRNVRRSNLDAQQRLHLAQEGNLIGASSQSEVILGLPGDTVEKHFHTIGGLMEAGFREIKMYQLMVLAGTELAAPETRVRFGLQTRYRVIPRSFSDYQVDAQSRVVTAEIEEIVTSQNTLSFEDYLRCRRFNLLVHLFYNDGVFLGVLDLLRRLGISRFEWIMTIFERPLPNELETAVEHFLRETRQELWESREELLAFTRKPESAHRFIHGELGGNLILKYKTLMVNNHLRELAGVARAATLDLLARKGKLASDVDALVDDILTFEVLRKIDLLKGDYAPHYATFRFDVKRFLASPDASPLAEFAFPQPQKFKFSLRDEQVQVIERSLNAYGRDLAGMARLSTRIHTNTLSREVAYA